MLGGNREVWGAGHDGICNAEKHKTAGEKGVGLETQWGETT